MAEEEKKNERLEQLLEKAKGAAGKLSMTEVQEFSETLSVDPDQILERCSAMQIELVDDDLGVDDIEDPAAAISNDEITNDDSVKIYLKEIGRVALLTADRKPIWPSGSPQTRRTSPQDSALPKRTSVWSSASQRSMSAEECSSSTSFRRAIWDC